MSRRLTTAVEIAAALAGLAYVLVASVQTPDHPEVHFGQLAVGVLLAFAAFVLLLVLYVAARLGVPPLRARWSQWRIARSRVRHRARRFGGRR